MHCSLYTDKWGLYSMETIVRVPVMLCFNVSEISSLLLFLNLIAFVPTICIKTFNVPNLFVYDGTSCLFFRFWKITFLLSFYVFIANFKLFLMFTLHSKHILFFCFLNRAVYIFENYIDLILSYNFIQNKTTSNTKMHSQK